VAIARGGEHLRIRAAGGGFTTHLDSKPGLSPFCPSVDVLFESAAVLGPAALGVVLTGMGNDGVEGARAVGRAGGRTVTESESSCVVYGMPRAVVEAGLSAADAPLEDLASLILRQL
jgi:two-component system chemotaxis response regulator CheB